MTAPGIPRCRLLCYPPDDLRDGLPLLVASNCFPIKATRFEPAGLSFHLAALSLSGWIFPTEEEDALPSDKKESSFVSPGVDSYFSKGKKKAGVVSEQKDHYSLLGLSHLRYLASEDQIRKAYREVALKFHPDKQASLLLQEETEEAKEAKKEEIDTHFKAIQEAYEVLIDPVKRRIYDSIDEFDDGVPSDCAPEDFFKVFGPVFMRNGRWSVIQPVLVLGDNDTPIEEVDEFYAFWYGFKSWREFPHADEFDLEQAESREHKRWMERQNLKLREKAKKEENVRMRTLVENAYKRDPRIARRKEEEKAEKQRKREAKFLAKKEKEEQAAKALEEERLRKVEEEKRLAEEAAIQKKIKEKEKKLIRKERARLRAATSDVIACQSSGVTDEDIDNLCIALDITQLRDLCEKIEKNKGVTEIQCQSLRTVLATLGVGTNSDHSLKSSNQKSDIGLNSSATQQLSNSADGVTSRLLVKEEKERPWSKEEVDLLRKAVVKYPKGTSQRWEVISNYIGTGRTVDEILKGVKSVLLQKPDTSKAFDTFLQKRKAPTDIVSPLSTREDGALPENQTLGRAATAVKKDFKAVNTETKLRNDNQGTKTPVVNGDGMEEHQINTVSNGSLTEQDTWSEIQELALVKALKTFPKDTAQRWERIAAAVPGKTKSQCFKKFAELREKFRNKKGAE